MTSDSEQRAHPTGSTAADETTSCFIEIRPPPSESTLPDRIEVYIARVKPQQCGSLIKDLQTQFGAREQAIAHLKRVRKCQGDSPNHTPTDSPPTKKAKTLDTCEVVLGIVSSDASNKWMPLLNKYSSTLETRWVPGRPAESKEELEEFNQEWPTVYFHKQTQQHKQEELELSPEEVNMMRRGMQHAINDACQARLCSKSGCDTTMSCVTGAVVMCPVSQQVVATANEERKLQTTDGQCPPDALNPLCTSVLLAIQGVSRKERAAAVGYGMDSETFQKGQYLCTGCDDCVLHECA